MSLRLDSLTVRTSSGRTLLEDVSWEAASGTRLGIIGESGSGKSLTALAVLGLLPEGMSVSGSVLLGGRELVGAPERDMRRIRGRRVAMVFQEPLTALDPLMRVGRQLEGPLRLHVGLRGAAARRRAAELLELVALHDTERILRSFPWQLSGGQRQRIALALALACEPEVLIADEPTTALDVTVQDEILTLMEDVIETSGTTLVFVSHDLPVVARITRELVVMREGTVAESGEMRRVLSSPTAPYTRELTAAARAVTALPPRADGPGASALPGGDA